MAYTDEEFEKRALSNGVLKCKNCPKHSEECDRIRAEEIRIHKEQHVRDNVSPHVSSHTLCWCCKKSVTGGCNWIDKKQPVDHWDATATDRGMFHSYHVLDCPEFERG
jgi:hypothetical protein